MLIFRLDKYGLVGPATRSCEIRHNNLINLSWKNKLTWLHELRSFDNIRNVFSDQSVALKVWRVHFCVKIIHISIFAYFQCSLKLLLLLYFLTYYFLLFSQVKTYLLYFTHHSIALGIHISFIQWHRNVYFSNG